MQITYTFLINIASKNDSTKKKSQKYTKKGYISFKYSNTFVTRFK